MRDISKRLTIARLEVRHRMEGKYQLGLVELGIWPEVESTLTLTEHDMIRFGLDPSEGLVGATVEVTLKAIPYPQEAPSPDTVLLTRLTRSTEVHQHYGLITPDKSEQRTFRLEAKTPVPGGTLVVLPPTYYELNLPLTEGEYRRLRGLPAGTALKVRLRRVGRGFRDVVLTYRGTLEDPRVFPQDYVALMVPLIRAMIAYFDDDVDVVGHYCGLEVEEENAQPGTDPRLGARAWRRQYFAVDPLPPGDWEAAFAESVARIDAVLKERYGNRLPMSGVQEFYDNIETSAWESKEPHPIEELSVGLQAKYVFREGYHLPSILIEARSVTGNRKACQAACEALSREAVALFGVRFDHTSLEIEEMGETGAPPS
ncbi:MAG: hypothetical protein NUW06_06935 [Candidatus Acetothermia bacterium]|jgi:hypothetical protein|nr:hypothetical protein [Candidatus Acetothermia bacterium]MDH7505858.1 hypothetical protein [Candidatus Acetothermia bacterium]